MTLAIDQRARPADALELAEALREGARGISPAGADSAEFATSAATRYIGESGTRPRRPGSRPGRRRGPRRRVRWRVPREPGPRGASSIATGVPPPRPRPRSVAAAAAIAAS